MAQAPEGIQASHLLPSAYLALSPVRSYDMRLQVLEAVPHQGETCTFCPAPTGKDSLALVAAHIAAISADNVPIQAHCCLGCLVYVLDNCMDIWTVCPVLVSVARGVR